MNYTAKELTVAGVIAFVIGVSKTGLPGGGLLAAPLMAEIAAGRAIAGTMLPILLATDLYAIRLFRRSVRWDLMRPLAPWVALGFALGAAFFISIGGAGRTLELVIGISTLVMVAIQATRTIRGHSPAEPSLAAAAFYGTGGGFTTFVSNAAGPIMNTYLLRLGLDKQALVRFVAWFFFAVNVGKIPVYLGLQTWSDAPTRFFTARSLGLAALVLPAIALGITAGRVLLKRLPERPFVIATLTLATLGGLRLVVG